MINYLINMLNSELNDILAVLLGVPDANLVFGQLLAVDDHLDLLLVQVVIPEQVLRQSSNLCVPLFQ